MGKEMTRVEQEIRKGGNYTLGLNRVAVENTTFWLDFGIADRFGERAVRDTYERAFDEWKEDIRYMTALCIVLNHKIWQLFGVDNRLARVYDRLWKRCGRYILECEEAGTEGEKYVNFNKDEVAYFVQATN